MEKSKQLLPFYRVALGFCFLYSVVILCYIVRAANVSVILSRRVRGKSCFLTCFVSIVNQIVQTIVFFLKGQILHFAKS